MECILLDENFGILIKISQQFVLEGLTNMGYLSLTWINFNPRIDK